MTGGGKATQTGLAVLVGILIGLAVLFSFSGALGLDLLFPGLETWKTTIVATVFLVGAAAGLFHRFNRKKTRRGADD